MKPGCAVDPHGGEEGQPDAELGQLTLPDLGEIGRRRGEVAPADHGESLIQTPPEDQQIALDTVEAGDPGQVRSEERRVGKEWRAEGGQVDREKKNSEEHIPE